MRKTIMAIAAAFALGTATMATGAIAAPHGHAGGFSGHPGGGFRGGGFRGGFYGPGIGLYAYDACWQRRLVPTPFGWRWRLVNVCY